MELCSMLCGSLDERGVWGRMDTCICMAGFPGGSGLKNSPVVSWVQMQCLCYSWPWVSFPCLEEDACCFRAVWPLHICLVRVWHCRCLSLFSGIPGPVASLVPDHWWGTNWGRPEPRVSTRLNCGWLVCAWKVWHHSSWLVSLFFFPVAQG